PGVGVPAVGKYSLRRWVRARLEAGDGGAARTLQTRVPESRGRRHPLPSAGQGRAGEDRRVAPRRLAPSVGRPQDFSGGDRDCERTAFYRRLRSKLWGASAEAGDSEAGAGSAGAEDSGRRGAAWGPRGGGRG